VASTEAPLSPIQEVLYFELNGTSLEPAQLAVLDLVEAQLRLAPANTRLVIEGHCDSSGPPSFNSSLSLMRASTVRLHLIRRGIPWRRLLIAARGSSRPIELDIDERGRARNRRVTFRVTRNQMP
jgi:OmpA-OmpF porin, OOP family